jgi:hypothetical protein
MASASVCAFEFVFASAIYQYCWQSYIVLGTFRNKKYALFVSLIVTVCIVAVALF